MKRAMAGLAGLIGVTSAILINSCANPRANSGPDQSDPPKFTSTNHQLDLLVIAEPQTISLGQFNPTAWVFAMCESAAAHNDSCPQSAQTVAPYGGIRLQLYPGDHLRMRLVNHLPPAPADAENAHGSDPMMNAMLAANPVNIHTHGLIVEPRKADSADPTYGDYVYVLGYPSGQMPSMVDPDQTATDQPIQYDIYIPADHPSGLYWFHPHVHGLGVNQLSEGLSGIITIGSPTDYLTPPSGSATIPTRYFTLKDMQVLYTGDVHDQEDALFCAPYPLIGNPNPGFCQGQFTGGVPDAHHADSGGAADYEGGAWFFTVNGQVFPQVSMSSSPGELWRLLNAGASRSYDLALQDDQTAAPIPFQVVSLDGVALAPPPGAVADQIRTATGAKVDPVPCPAQPSGSTSQPVCATHLVMFPSARAEIWVSPPAHSATLRTLMVDTGSAGDRWPEASLAHIAIASTTTSARASVLQVRPVAKSLLSSQGLLGAPVRAAFAADPSLRLEDAKQFLGGKSALPARVSAAQIISMQKRLADLSKPVPSLASPTCSALPAGHRRRIFFGIPSTAPNSYGFGYEELDQNSNPVSGTFQDVAAFDPAQLNVCLPLGPGNTPVTEDWELVNLAAEAHNFHIHQTKFTVLLQNAPEGDAGALMDNVVLPNGGATCDGSVATWRSGGCPVQSVVVEIPFAEVGDFVYHCHIGEHQDGGMMAHIRVIAAP